MRIARFLRRVVTVFGFTNLDSQSSRSSAPVSEHGSLASALRLQLLSLPFRCSLFAFEPAI